MNDTVKVLLVDDEPGFLEQAEIFLKKEDERLDITTVPSAEKALDIIDEDDHDVIVSDYQMPDMNGLEFLKEIREEREVDIPFIIFTGKGREEVAMKALNLGADRYLQKGGDPKSQYGVLAQAIVQEVRHHRTERSLRRKNEVLEQIFEKSEEGFYIREISGELTFVNDAFAEIHGYESEELIGMDSRSLLTQESEKKVEELDFDNLKDRWFGVEIVTKDGKKKNLRNAVFPLKDEKGDMRKVFGISRDITEEKQKEEKFRASEERYRRLFETAQDGMLILDVKTGVIKDANPYIRDLLGYAEKELIGKKIWEIGSFQSVAENKERFDDLTEEGYVRYEDLPLITKKGKKIPVEFVSNTYEVSGEKVAQCNIREISERKKSEQELKRKEIYLDHIPEFFNVIDEDGEVIYRSQTFLDEDVLDSEEIVGSNFLEFVHPDDREKVQETFFKLLENPGEEYRMELRGKTSDGWEWFEGRAVNYLDDPEIDGIILTGQKIGERKKLEEELKSRSKAMEASIDGMAILDEDEEYIYMNEAHAKIHGYDDPDELLGKKRKVLYDEEELKRFEEEIMPKFREKGKWRGEALGKKKDGTIFSQELSLTALEDGGLICVVRDIKDRKEREKELNLLYRVLKMGQKPDYSLTDILKKTVQIIPRSFQHPEMTAVKILFDHEEFKSEYYEESGSKLESQITVDGEKRGSIQIYYKGERSDEEIEPFLEEEKNLIEGVAGIVENTIEQKERKESLEESEKRYRSLIENSIVGVSISNFKDEIIFVNERFADMLGYTKEEMVGKHISYFTTEEEYRKVSEKTEERKKGESELYEIKLMKKDGSFIHVMLGAAPYVEHQGEMKGTVAFFQDISRRKELEERERFLHSLLRHDIRNKIQVIDGYHELMRMDCEISDKAKEYLEKARKGVENSIELIEKIRTLREAQDEEMQEIELKSMIKDLIQEKEGQIENIELEMDIGCIDECLIKAGPLLKEVFSNIIENSVKYSQGTKIRISAEEKDEEVICSIEDDGKGIPEEKRETIFDKGYTTDGERGTGLGLFLVKKLMEIYRGKIEVKDSDMGGARFDIHMKKP